MSGGESAGKLTPSSVHRATGRMIAFRATHAQMSFPTRLQNLMQLWRLLQQKQSVL